MGAEVMMGIDGKIIVGDGVVMGKIVYQMMGVLFNGNGYKKEVRG